MIIYHPFNLTGLHTLVLLDIFDKAFKPIEMNRYLKIPSMLIAAIIFAASCNSDDEFDPGTPPEVPPITTMVMDVENFTEGTTSAAFMEGRVKSKLNWTGAAIQVGFWNTILALNIALPVAAFGASINEDPEFDRERGVWVWTYEHSFVGRTYTCELTGKIIEDQVEWNMYISEEEGFQNVLWFTGMMKLDVSSGSWTVSRNGNDPREYLEIDWVKENEEIGSIRYELIEDGLEDKGSYIEYGRIAEGDYDVFYVVEIVSTQKSANIEWNSETGVGRVEYNNSGEYLCWDSNFDDVDCE